MTDVQVIQLITYMTLTAPFTYLLVKFMRGTLSVGGIFLLPVAGMFTWGVVQNFIENWLPAFM